MEFTKKYALIGLFALLFFGFASANLFEDTKKSYSWKSLNSYPAPCAAGYAVRGIGDTLTCVLVGDANYVPYTGATQHVNLGAYNLIANNVGIGFDFVGNEYGAVYNDMSLATTLDGLTFKYGGGVATNGGMYVKFVDNLTSWFGVNTNAPTMALDVPAGNANIYGVNIGYDFVGNEYGVTYSDQSLATTLDGLTFKYGGGVSQANGLLVTTSNSPILDTNARVWNGSLKVDKNITADCLILRDGTPACSVAGGSTITDTNWQTSWTTFDTNMGNTYQKGSGAVNNVCVWSDTHKQTGSARLAWNNSRMKVGTTTDFSAAAGPTMADFGGRILIDYNAAMGRAGIWLNDSSNTPHCFLGMYDDTTQGFFCGGTWVLLVGDSGELKTTGGYWAQGSEGVDDTTNYLIGQGPTSFYADTDGDGYGDTWLYAFSSYCTQQIIGGIVTGCI